MPYIGRGIETLSDRVVLDSLTASATASYTLQLNSVNFVPSSASSLTVSLNGVIQKPESSYTVSSSTLTFSSALTSSDSIDFIIAERDITLQTPSAGSVGASQLASSAVTAAKLNNDIISGSTELAATPAGTDELLISDAGTLKRIDASFFQSTPAFQAYRTSYQSIANNTETKVQNNVELFDTDSAYDSTNQYRFTIPSGKAGKYLIGAGNTIDNVADTKYVITRVRKNGSDLKSVIQSSSGGYPLSAELTFIEDASEGDYYESWVKHLDGSTSDLRYEYTNYFWAMRLIGV